MNDPNFDVCIFCLTVRSNVKPTCNYGMHHEFPTVVKKAQTPKPSKSLCTKCGLHPKNPLAMANGCGHEYAA
jgi:hypothetical protein